jgi:hypothetical protein
MLNLSLERLLYDATANAGPQLGAFLLGKSGNLIDYTNANSKDGLNVYLINSDIAVTATAFDIRALTNADVVTAEQGTDPWVVSATAFDIRALTNADVVTAEQGTDPWVVSATAFDIRALTNADVVTAEQGTDPWVVSGSVIIASPNAGLAAAAFSCTDVAAPCPATSLASRQQIQIQNLGSDPVYIGPSGVSVGSGIKIEKGGTWFCEIGPQSVYAVAPTGKTVALRVLEIS